MRSPHDTAYKKCPEQDIKRLNVIVTPRLPATASEGFLFVASIEQGDIEMELISCIVGLIVFVVSSIYAVDLAMSGLGSRK